jgi:hypothetical protein
MPIYNEKGEWVSAAIPKGEKKAKKGSKPTKKDDKKKETAEKSEDDDEKEADSQRTRKEINNRNRNFGKSVERRVAELTDGHRVVASGAIKTSIWNLLGDVQVPFDDSHDTLAVIECKGTSGITPKGDKTYTLKKSVLDQMVKEADLMKAVGLVWVHWLSASYENDDYVVMRSHHFLKLLSLARQVDKDSR